MTGIILIVLILIIFVINGIRLSKQESERISAFLRDSFGKVSNRKLTETRKISLDNYLQMTLSGKEDCLDELTWSDTGMEDIFLQMDNCLSSAGEEYLYRQLHDISGSTEELAATDRVVKEISEKEDLRIALGQSF